MEQSVRSGIQLSHVSQTDGKELPTGPKLRAAHFNIKVVR
jgi:hypothetical protein